MLEVIRRRSKNRRDGNRKIGSGGKDSSTDSD